jgi:hypothetical protein
VTDLTLRSHYNPIIVLPASGGKTYISPLKDRTVRHFPTLSVSRVSRNGPRQVIRPDRNTVMVDTTCDTFNEKAERHCLRTIRRMSAITKFRTGHWKRENVPELIAAHHVVSS